MKNLKLYDAFVAFIGIPAVLTTITIKGNGVKCDIESCHAHKYIKDGKIVRYLDKEVKSYKGFERQDDYIELTDEENDLINYAATHDLIRIDDNINYIKEVEERNKEYIEYEYSYDGTKLRPLFLLSSDKPKVYLTAKNKEKFGWTTDSNHENLTGKERICNFVYEGWTISKDHDRKLSANVSSKVKSLLDINDEYQYFEYVDNMKGTYSDDDIFYQIEKTEVSSEEDKSLTK